MTSCPNIRQICVSMIFWHAVYNFSLSICENHAYTNLANLPLIMEHRHTETLLPEICKKKGTALSYLI